MNLDSVSILMIQNHASVYLVNVGIVKFFMVLLNLTGLVQDCCPTMQSCAKPSIQSCLFSLVERLFSLVELSHGLMVIVNPFATVIEHAACMIAGKHLCPKYCICPCVKHWYGILLGETQPLHKGKQNVTDTASFWQYKEKLEWKDKLDDKQNAEEELHFEWFWRLLPSLN